MTRDNRHLHLINLRGLDVDQRLFAKTWWTFWLIRQNILPEDEERYKNTLIPPIDHLLDVHFAFLSDESVRRCAAAKAKWHTMQGVKG